MTPKRDPRCKKCHGQFSAGGVQTRRVPTGLGFVDGSAKFQVDFIEIKSYIGFCIDCGDETPVEFSRRNVTKFPKSINRKIAAARSTG
jgi:hypothetical protein